MGEEQVLAFKMWKTVVIQNRHDCSLSNDGHADSKGKITVFE